MSAADRGRLLDRLASGPERIARAARAAGAAETLWVVPPGEWSAREVVGHLVATECEVFQARLDDLAADRSPRWEWVEPGVPDSPEIATLERALAAFADARDATLVRVAALDEAGWARSGIHARLGELDVVGLLGVAVEHDDDHHDGLLARATMPG